LPDGRRVPKLQITAEIVLVNRKPTPYKLFLTENSSGEGCERPSDMLHGSRTFLPAVAADGGIVFLPVDAMVILSMPAELEFPPAGAVAAWASDVLRAELELDLKDGTQLYGLVTYTAPEGSTRIQDFLNRPERFITLRQDATVVFINKLHVTRIAPRKER
jgi:hypothetical protein